MTTLPLCSRLGVELMRFGMLGKDFYRGLRIAIAGAVMIVVLDVALELLSSGNSRIQGFLARPGHVGTALGVIWVVAAYAIGLGIAVEEEDDGPRGLLETLPVPLRQHYWMKGLAGIGVTLGFLPILMCLYSLVFSVIPGTQSGMVDMLRAVVGSNGVALVCGAMGAMLIGLAWGVLLRGNPALGALLGGVSSFIFVPLFLSLLHHFVHSSTRYTSIHAMAVLLPIGLIKYAYAAAAWNLRARDVRSMAERIGIKIDIKLEGTPSIAWRLLAFPALVTTIGGAGIAYLLTKGMLHTAGSGLTPDMVSHLGSFLAGPIGALMGAILSAMMAQQGEQEGSRFFLYYQPVNQRAFVLRRMATIGYGATLVGAAVALGIFAGMRTVPSLHGALLPLAVATSTACGAGWLCYALSSCFRLKLIVGITGLITAVVLFTPAIGSTALFWFTSQNNLAAYQFGIVAELNNAEFRSLTEGFTLLAAVQVVWSALLVLVIPGLLAWAFNDVFRFRELSDRLREVVGAALVLQLILLGPALGNLSPADLWLLLFS